MANIVEGLRDYFLTRTSPVGLDMFKSIMDLSKDEAERLTAEFTNKSSCRGSYYDHRKEVEDWLRTKAIDAGVTMETETPLYFSLTQDAQDGLVADGNLINISLPTEDVDLSQCSFTVSDSFCNHEYIATNGEDAYGEDHPLLGQVFNAAQIAEAIRQHNLMDYLGKNPHSYIEIQMWARPK